MPHDDFDFSDLRPAEQAVTGPDGKKYVLREASADAATRFREANLRARRFEDGKMVGYNSGLAESELLLLALCLCETDDRGNLLEKRDGTPVLVPEVRVRGWPNQVTAKLYEWVTDHSPGLLMRATRETLAKDRAKIDEQLAALDAAERGEDPADPKGRPSDGADSST